MAKRRIEYIIQAKQEILDAIAWYDERAKGLGFEFLMEMMSAEFLILDNPGTWPAYEAGTRRYLMKRFPFAVVYILSDELIQIVSISHLKRRPGYWKARLLREPGPP